MQDFDHRVGELSEVPVRVAIIFGDKAKGNVAQVVKDRPTPGGPAGNDDVMFTHVIKVDLFIGVLIAAKNDARRVDVKVEDRLIELGVLHQVGF